MRRSGRTFFLRTYGCQMNAEDSRRLAHLLRRSGYEEVPSAEMADAVIVNTCAVRAHAVRRALSWVTSLQRVSARGSVVCLIGCAAELLGNNALGGVPGVSVICGPQHLGQLPRLLADAFDGRRSVTIGPSSTSVLPAAPAAGVSAAVPITRGCDNLCSYCVVPYTRGRLRSRPENEIFGEIREAVAGGVCEILLLGQNVNEYGRDRGNTSFPDLLERVCDIPGILRLGFLTSHPKDVSDCLVSNLAAIPNLYRHVHLPVQSGSDRILTSMNRGYSSRLYHRLVDRLRSAVPGIRITSDIIVGFPGETPEDFDATVRLVASIRFDDLFVFKYSARPGTPAALMAGAIDPQTIEHRHQEILAMQDEISLRQNERFGGTVSRVLALRMSTRHAGCLVGHTEEEMAVLVPGDETDRGRIIPVRIERAGRRYLEGVRINPDNAESGTIPQKPGRE